MSERATAGKKHFLDLKNALVDMVNDLGPNDDITDVHASRILVRLHRCLGTNALGVTTGETREQILERAISFSFAIDDFYDKEMFLKYVYENDFEILCPTNGWPEFMLGAEEPEEQ